MSEKQQNTDLPEQNPSEEVLFPAAEPKSKLPKGAKIAILAAAILAVLLLTLIIVGSLTNWFGFTGPVMNLSRAMESTFADRNLTMDIRYEVSGQEFSGTMGVVLDPETDEVMAQGRVSVYGLGMNMAIYKNNLILDTFLGSFRIDLDVLPTADEEALPEVETSLLAPFSPALQEQLDPELAEECFMEFAKQLNDESWLTANAAYTRAEVDGLDVYTLSPDLYELLSDALTSLKPAFYEAADYEAALAELEADREQLSAMELIFTFRVRPGKLFDLLPGTLVGLSMSGITPATEETPALPFLIDLTFSKIGTTQVDEDALKELLEESIAF